MTRPVRRIVHGAVVLALLGLGACGSDEPEAWPWDPADGIALEWTTYRDPDMAPDWLQRLTLRADATFRYAWRDAQDAEAAWQAIEGRTEGSGPRPDGTGSWVLLPDEKERTDYTVEGIGPTVQRHRLGETLLLPGIDAAPGQYYWFVQTVDCATGRFTPQYSLVGTYAERRVDASRASTRP